MLIFISGWWLFCVAATLLLIVALAMQYYGGFFITKDVLVRSFTIMDLELAATEAEIDNTLNGIVKLEPAVASKVVASLRKHLYADFVFMPAAYGSIFIACMKVAWKMPESGAILFSVLAWLQVAAWISDVLENIYLLAKISRLNEKSKPSYLSFRMYQYLELIKWGFSMLASVCVLSALLYFWVSGLYMGECLKYLLIIVIEMAVFVGLMRVSAKAGRGWKAAIHH